MAELLQLATFVASVLAMAVSSLVYIRQERQKAILDNRLAEERFTESYAGLNRILIQHPELWCVYGERAARISSPRLRSRMRALCFLQLNLFAAVGAAYEYGERAMSRREAPQWRAWMSTMKSFLFESAFARDMWEQGMTRRHYHHDFCRLMDRLKREVDEAITVSVNQSAGEKEATMLQGRG